MSRINKIIALSPVILLLIVFLVCSFVTRSSYQVPVLVVFLFTSVYAVLISRGNIEVFSGGAANSRIMYMIWIFILAGAFAAVARRIGSVEATVAATLTIIPVEYLPVGLFIASCFISFSIGTSVGTIVALCPLAVGVATDMSTPVEWYVAIVAGGAFFGDNLSFISDTTIAATQTQGCSMKDKFRSNFFLVLPAAVLTAAIYFFSARVGDVDISNQQQDILLIVPYILVIVLALIGVNVLTALIISLSVAVLIALCRGIVDVTTLFDAIVEGVSSMSELIVVTMMAGGILAVVKHLGGLDYAIELIRRRIGSRMHAEFAIAEISALANLCTANNTIAILSVGDIAKKISETYGIPARRSASIMDTVSCFIQGIIPYGAQLLMASGIAKISPMAIVPNLYYPILIGVSVASSIVFRSLFRKNN